MRPSTKSRRRVKGSEGMLRRGKLAQKKKRVKGRGGDALEGKV